MSERHALITGGAGFIGRHLSRRLCSEGVRVLALDNFYSSAPEGVAQLQKEFSKLFMFIQHDVRTPFLLSELPAQEWGWVFHLACPASPPIYARDPVYTLETNYFGVKNFLELSRDIGARFIFTSTSEIYGDPEKHPQRETYRGAVNTWGPRACYDEGKRVGETWCYLAETEWKVAVRVARVFNTYGPGMLPSDGRVITNFIRAARLRQPYPVYGDGKQTRSFCFVEDLVEGLWKLAQSDLQGPVNLGNPTECSVLDLAREVHRMLGTGEFRTQLFPLPQDDPSRRCPDISRAQKELNWEPSVSLGEGIQRMAAELPHEDAPVQGFLAQ